MVARASQANGWFVAAICPGTIGPAVLELWDCCEYEQLWMKDGCEQSEHGQYMEAHSLAGIHYGSTFSVLWWAGINHRSMFFVVWWAGINHRSMGFFCAVTGWNQPWKHVFCALMVWNQPWKHVFCASMGWSQPQKHVFCVVIDWNNQRSIFSLFCTVGSI